MTHLRSLPIPFPGPGTYTLPRILGPNTICTHANPCYSMVGKSQYQSAFRDLAKVSCASLFSHSSSSSAALLRAEGPQHLPYPHLTHTSLHLQQSPRSHRASSSLLLPAALTPAVPHFSTLAALVWYSSLALTPQISLWEIYLSSQGALLPKAPDLPHCSSGQPPKAAQYSWAPGKNPHCLLYPPTSLLLLQTPGPAAFGRVEMDVYKTRAPKYTMGLKTKLIGKGMFPGPADYSLGKVRQPTHQRVRLNSLHLRTALENEAPSSPFFFPLSPSSCH